jgi:hypothetical protein
MLGDVTSLRRGSCVRFSREVGDGEEMLKGVGSRTGEWVSESVGLSACGDVGGILRGWDGPESCRHSYSFMGLNGWWLSQSS